MNEFIFIPNRLRSAGREVRQALKLQLDELSHEKFQRVWCSVAYLFPCLHPDGFDDMDSGWPHVLQRFADEAWRRADEGELTDAELYCCDAQWCGLYDRMHIHKQDETDRRLALAADYGESLDA